MLSELEIEIGSDINNSQSNSDKNVVSLTLTTSIKKKKWMRALQNAATIPASAVEMFYL